MLSTRHPSPFPMPRLRPAVTTTGLAFALVVGLGIGPATAAHASSTPAAHASRVNPVTSEIKQADAALDSAVHYLNVHRYPKARRSLADVRSHGEAAQQKATGLIGAPPTDPESDDPPGPPAVLAVLKLDRRIDTGVLAPFDNLTRKRSVQALIQTLESTQAGRDTMLDKVIALPPEGAGADYSDGMADTLPMFAKEVKAINTAVTTFTLTAPANAGLTDALARARATQAKMTKAYGGGERPAPPTTRQLR